MAFDPGVVEAQKQAVYLKKYGLNVRERAAAEDTLYARQYQRA